MTQPRKVSIFFPDRLSQVHAPAVGGPPCTAMHRFPKRCLELAIIYGSLLV